MISQCIRIGVMKDIPFWTKLFCSRHLLSAGPLDLAGCTVWTILRINCHHHHRHNHQKNDWNPQDSLRLRPFYVFGRSPTAGNSRTWDQGCSGAFLPVRDFKGWNWSFWTAVVALKAPEWVQMTHDDVFYPCEMFWGHLELPRAAFEVPGNFIQWNPEFWHFWDGNFECLKMAFFGVRLKFAPLFLR